MPASTAVIIGGGVIGLSTAYHLALERFGRIIVLDKGLIGEGASSRAAGITTALLWTPTGIRARKVGVEWFARMSEELDGYTYHNEHGCLMLFDPAGWSERRVLLPLYDQVGSPYEILDPSEMRRRWPAVRPAEDSTGLWDPRGGYSEPSEYIPGLANRIREMGAEIREQQKVTGFLQRGGRITGVRTSVTDVEADAVVCTVHVWHLPVIKELGLAFPTKSFEHQRFVTAPFEEPLSAPPINSDRHEGYIRPASGNRVLMGFGSGEDREDWPVTSTDFHMSEVKPIPGRLEAGVRCLSQLLPQLAEASWETEHVGLLNFSMDGEPIVGPVSRRPGLYVGASFHSGGFSYNTVAGLLLAEFVADGRTSIDVSAFSPDRFDPEETNAYQAKRVKAKEAVRRRH